MTASPIDGKGITRKDCTFTNPCGFPMIDTNEGFIFVSMGLVVKLFSSRAFELLGLKCVLYEHLLSPTC